MRDVNMIWRQCLVLLLVLVPMAWGQWTEPFLELSQEAIDAHVTVHIAGENVHLDYPEELPVGLVLGTLQFTSDDAVTITCRKSLGTGGADVDPLYTIQENNQLTMATQIDFEKLEPNFLEYVCKFAVTGEVEKPFVSKVTNTNDNLPRFVENLVSTINLDENTDYPEPIIYISGQDDDNLGSVTCELEVPTGPFQLEQAGDGLWNLTLSTQLDFEDQRSYQLDITLIDTKDQYGTVNRETQSVYVRVIDQSDTPPIWISFPSLHDIQENQTLDEKLFEVRARDGDSFGSKIKYEIESITLDGEDYERSILAISESGEVTLIEPVDREALGLNNIFEIRFRATEESCLEVDYPICSNNEATTSLRVYDVDDNTPTITAPITPLKVPENFMGFLSFDADILIQDDDYDPGNSQFDVEIRHEDQAFLNTLSYTKTGVQSLVLLIRVSGGTYWDYETIKDISFDLVVTPSGSTNEADEVVQNFNITLTDVNDNEPHFTKDEYLVKVREDLDGLKPSEDGVFTLFDGIKALDSDASDSFGNKSIRYEMSSSIPLTIDPLTGVVTFTATNIFDYELRKSFEISISVRDSITEDGTSLPGSLFGSSVLKIQVIDVNDEPPVFTSQPDQTFCLYENETSMWLQDLCNGQDPRDFLFEANDQDLNPALKLEIDRNFTVARKDNRVVNLKDYDYLAFINLVPQSSNINSISGVLKLAEDTWIDREKVDQLSLVINVVDENTETGSRFSRSTMVIDIIDLDDSKPEFVNSESWKFEINEIEDGADFTPDEQVLIQRILVSDNDLSQEFTFSIEGDDMSNGLITFMDNSNQLNEGALVIHEKIDREKLGDSGKLSYTLTVTDGNNNFNSIQIEVTVRDLNDCEPIFGGESYVFRMQESNLTAEFVVQANDGDISPAFSKVFYPELRASTVIFPFVIDEDTGVITINCPEESLKEDQESCIDFDEGLQSYQFTAFAADNKGGNSNFVPVPVQVMILDDNDNPPVIDPSGSFIENQNTLNPIQEWFQYTATDKDSEANSEVQFTVATSTLPPDFPFKVELNGKLFATKPLNEPQVHQVYAFQLIATDKGIPPQKSTLDCNISIVDVNDFVPEFTFPITDDNLYIPDDLKEGPVTFMNGSTVTVMAEDGDVFEPYKTVNFKLNNPSGAVELDFFKIDIKTGALSLKRPIADFVLPADNIITLKIRAFDNPEADEDSQNYNEKDLKIQPVRNYEPYFDTEQAPISFKEGNDTVENPFPEPLVEAKDENSEVFQDDICYFIADPEMAELFSLGKRTNILSVKTPLDHEEEPNEYEFQIITTNNCDSMPNPDDVVSRSKLNISVIVEDINDTPPRFEEDPIYEGISVEDDQLWEKTIVTLDPDVGDSRFEFQLGPISASDNNVGLEAIKDGAFEVQKTGPNAVITAKFTRQETMKGFFTFNLTVWDTNRVHETTKEVKVVVIALENQIILRFENPPEEVDALDTEIKALFENNFESWIFTKDASKPDVETAKAVTIGTHVDCHFLDSDINPVNRRDAQAIYEKVFRQLTLDLASFNLTLRKENGFGTGEIDDSEDGEGANAATIVLIIATALLAVLFACLVVTYFIRVHNLERKVKAMGAQNFGSQDSGLNQFGMPTNEGLPNANQFASSGANPIFNIEDDTQDFTQDVAGLNTKFNNKAYDNSDSEQDYDLSSEDSDNLVLRGVENQADFKHHQDQNQVIGEAQFTDSDMDSDSSGDVVDKKFAHQFAGGTRDAPVINLDGPFGGGSAGGVGGGNPLYQSDDEDV